MDLELEKSTGIEIAQKIALNSAKYTALAGTAGATVGFLWAHMRNHPRIAFTISMGSNWCLAGIPFFTVRESILSFQQWKRVKEGADFVQFKDRDAAIASISGGAFTGLLAALYMRGPLFVPGGMIMYGVLAAVGQTAFTGIRHWRLQQGLSQLEHDYTSDDKQSGPRPHWKDGMWKENVPLGIPPPPERTDPIGDILKWAIQKFDAWLGRPEWSSPLRNALSFDHRLLLNMKIVVLQDQIKELENEIAQIENKSVSQQS